MNTERKKKKKKKKKKFNDSNTDGTLTVVDSNSCFESLWNSSDSSKNNILEYFREFFLF